jgi:hypothetical protein
MLQAEIKSLLKEDISILIKVRIQQSIIYAIAVKQVC